MAAMCFQPWPTDPVPPGLTPEQKLSYAAFNLEMHAEETKDKIRLNGLCEAEYANPESIFNPIYHRKPQQDPRPPTFREAARSQWKRGAPVPTVKASRKILPAFHLEGSNTKAAIAKRTIARLDEYDAMMKPTIDRLNAAAKGENEAGANVDVVGNSTGLRSNDHPVTNEPSRDPRLMRRDT